MWQAKADSGVSFACHSSTVVEGFLSDSLALDCLIQILIQIKLFKFLIINIDLPPYLQKKIKLFL